MGSKQARAYVAAGGLVVALAAVPSAAAAQADTGHGSDRASVVLGKRHVFGPYSRGFGRAHPQRIFNGGVPSGTAFKLTWRRWGKARSKAHGLTWLYKPSGGYYSKPGRIVLRAQKIKRCGGHRAYSRLMFRAAKKPGQPVSGRWKPWLGGNICHWA